MSYVENPLIMNDTLKEIVWMIICSNKTFKFYELPGPRGELKVYNHFENFDKVGVIREMVSFFFYFLHTSIQQYFRFHKKRNSIQLKF